MTMGNECRHWRRRWTDATPDYIRKPSAISAMTKRTTKSASTKTDPTNGVKLFSR